MDMKAQRFGIEVEMTGITHERAAQIAADYFGTSSRYLGAGYDTYAAGVISNKSCGIHYQKLEIMQSNVGKPSQTREKSFK